MTIFPLSLSSSRPRLVSRGEHGEIVGPNGILKGLEEGLFDELDKLVVLGVEEGVLVGIGVDLA